jgi:branched-chain amino acid transport system substrate-binding protein
MFTHGQPRLGSLDSAHGARRRINRRLVTGAMTSIVLLAATACASASAGGGGGAGGSSSPWSIGFLPTSSGVAAANGIALDNGAALAISQINARGGVDGHKIQGVYDDTQLTPSLGVSEFQKMISLQHVQAVVAQASPVLLALEPLAARNKVVIINHAGIDPTIANPSRYTITTIANAQQESEVLADYIAKNFPNIHTMATLCDNSAIGQSAAAEIAKAFEAHGGKIVDQESYDFSTVTFTADLARIQAKHPQAIFSDNASQAEANMLKEAHQLGMNVQWFGNTFFATDNLPLAGGLANGLVYSDVPFIGTSSPAAAAFESAFQAKFHSQPSIYAATGYDAVNMIAYAMKKVGNDGSKLLNVLLHLKDFQGVTGSLTMDPSTGQITMPIQVREVKQSAPVTVATYMTVPSL